MIKEKNLKFNRSLFMLLCLLLFICFTVNLVSADCTGTVSYDEHGGTGYDYDDGIDGPYVDNGDGTVTDQGTELMWQLSCQDRSQKSLTVHLACYLRKPTFR